MLLSECGLVLPNNLLDGWTAHLEIIQLLIPHILFLMSIITCPLKITKKLKKKNLHGNIYKNEYVFYTHFTERRKIHSIYVVTDYKSIFANTANDSFQKLKTQHVFPYKYSQNLCEIKFRKKLFSAIEKTKQNMLSESKILWKHKYL